MMTEEKVEKPQEVKDNNELTDEELEQVAGGVDAIKTLFNHKVQQLSLHYSPALALGS